MNLNIKTTTKVDDAALFIANSITNQLEKGKKVLFFATGGSSISVASKMAEFLKDKSLTGLTVMLTDERYGELNHKDSNWYQLMQKGFELPGAILIPILIGEGIEKTTEKFAVILEQNFAKAEYKIGLFGVGKDGHTAGNLPDSPAVTSPDLAACYVTPSFSRITMTPEAIIQLDEAVAWIQGEEKWPVIENLKNEIELVKQPVQILKKVPLLTIFTDFSDK
jgi:6-phosphogluconolactonase/glucosamine-6-phosphate isomerase/deaminase